MALSFCDLMGLVLLAEDEDDRSDLSRNGNSLVEIMGPTGLAAPFEDILCGCTCACGCACGSLDAFREIC